MKLNLFSGNSPFAGRGNERRWVIMKITRVASVGTLAGLALVACVLGGASSARALTTSDKPAAILIWPKIVVDSGSSTDTVIQLSNTTTGASAARKQAHCF